MEAVDITQYLHANIPISEKMGVRVVRAMPAEIVLEAPLAPNVNHRNTVFGGSAVSLATLACWALLYSRLHAEGLSGRLVIQRSTMDYTKPITADFSAVCRVTDERGWRVLRKTLDRRGKGRISMRSTLCCRAENVANFHGEFVVITGDESEVRESDGIDDGNDPIGLENRR